EIDRAECERRLAELRKLLDAHPRVRVSLSSVLLRITVTIGGTQSEADWKHVFEHSVLSDRQRVQPTDEGARRLRELEAALPDGLLEEFLRARKRNQWVNQALLPFAGRVD